MPPCLGRAVSAECGTRIGDILCADGNNVPSGSLPFENRDGRLDHIEGPLEIDGDHLIKSFRIQILDGRNMRNTHMSHHEIYTSNSTAHFCKSIRYGFE